MNMQYGLFPEAVPGPGPVVTMDSREIAELVGKRHDHVLRDIEEQLGPLGGLPRFGDTYRNEQNGQTYRCYKLPFRETMILLSGYKVELRAKVVDRWLELERSGAEPAFKLPDFTKPAVAARAWAEQFERAESLRPLAAAATVISDAAGLRLLSEVGKINGIGPMKIFELLASRGIIFRQRGDWVPKQEHIDSGYFLVRETTYDGPDGKPHLKKQTYVTGRGEIWLAKKLFAKERAI
jgi:phage regulator Rha-like protein